MQAPAATPVAATGGMVVAVERRFRSRFGCDGIAGISPAQLRRRTAPPNPSKVESFFMTFRPFHVADIFRERVDAFPTSHRTLSSAARAGVPLPDARAAKAF